MLSLIFRNVKLELMMWNTWVITFSKEGLQPDRQNPTKPRLSSLVSRRLKKPLETNSVTKREKNPIQTSNSLFYEGQISTVVNVLSVYWKSFFNTMNTTKNNLKQEPLNLAQCS